MHRWEMYSDDLVHIAICFDLLNAFLLYEFNWNCNFFVCVEYCLYRYIMETTLTAYDYWILIVKKFDQEYLIQQPDYLTKCFTTKPKKIEYMCNTIDVLISTVLVSKDPFQLHWHTSFIQWCTNHNKMANPTSARQFAQDDAVPPLK